MRRRLRKVEDDDFPDRYEPGELEAESISRLIDHARLGNAEDTIALWRELAADRSDADDEGRWLRSIAQIVVGQILDQEGLTQEERGRAALDALGLRDAPKSMGELERDMEALTMFDDLTQPGRVLSELEVYKAMERLGHFKGLSYHAGRQRVRRRMALIRR